MDDLQRLRSKLSRELAQSEQSARVHPLREARRLGDVPPATALLAISNHASSIKPRLEALLHREPKWGIGLARAIGHAFSAFRSLAFDQIVDVERSFRGTLLGLYHGLDVAAFLHEVAKRDNDVFLANFCADLIEQRRPLIENARRSLAWFAEQPVGALRSGLLAGLVSGR